MRVLATMSALLLALAACGGGGDAYRAPTTPGTPNPPGGPGAPAPNTVQVQDNSFDPTSTSASVGATVTWNWSGYNLHNVTFDNGSGTSGDKTSGTYQRTFNAAGTFTYKCSIHGATMSGTVVVQ